MQLFSYERLGGVLRDLFRLGISEGALAALRRARVRLQRETGARSEEVNAYHWGFLLQGHGR